MVSQGVPFPGIIMFTMGWTDLDMSYFILVIIEVLAKGRQLYILLPLKWVLTHSFVILIMFMVLGKRRGGALHLVTI